MALWGFEACLLIVRGFWCIPLNKSDFIYFYLKQQNLNVLKFYYCKGFHNLTLLDGEMVIDKIPDVGLKRRYLIYDLVALSSRSVVKVSGLLLKMVSVFD